MLKDDLREFARQTAGLAFPAPSGEVALPINSDPNKYNSFIAPSDGLFTAYANGEGIYIDVSVGHTTLGVISSAQSFYGKAFVACAKGEKISPQTPSVSRGLAIQ